MPKADREGMLTCGLPLHGPHLMYFEPIPECTLREYL
jgi:hypothetical protein